MPAVGPSFSGLKKGESPIISAAVYEYKIILRLVAMPCDTAICHTLISARILAGLALLSS